MGCVAEGAANTLTLGAACMFDPDLADYVFVSETEHSSANKKGLHIYMIMIIIKLVGYINIMERII